MEDTTNNNCKKRNRDDSSESVEDAKRLREHLLLDVLNNDADSGCDRDPATEDIATIIKRLEEEIGLPPSSGPSQPDLGYLLEASDDELGLPPTATVPSTSDDVVEVVQIPDDKPESVVFGQIWGFDDEFSGFDGGLGFGIPPVDGLGFDGGIFDYPQFLYGGHDLSDFFSRPESLPAIRK